MEINKEIKILMKPNIQIDQCLFKESSTNNKKKSNLPAISNISLKGEIKFF